jgi:hypothetical protein
MSSTFTKKRLDLTITLSDGQFGDAGNTVTLTGLRMTADLINPGGDSMGALQLRVFGLPQSMMNRLTTIGDINRVNPMDAILLSAGDDVSGMQMVFKGTIYDAWADYNSAPQVAFNVVAFMGMDALVKPVGASSFQGATDVATIMEGFSKVMGLAFENNGVAVTLSNPYFSGTALNQARLCAQAANIWYSVDRGVLAIWPKTGARQGEIPLISPETGMVGYPALNSKGMSVQTLFNWNIRPGGQVKVQSSIPMANGLFTLGPFSHSLSSEIPGGPWFTTLECHFVRK